MTKTKPFYLMILCPLCGDFHQREFKSRVSAREWQTDLADGFIYETEEEETREQACPPCKERYE